MNKQIKIVLCNSKDLKEENFRYWKLFNSLLKEDKTKINYYKRVSYFNGLCIKYRCISELLQNTPIKQDNGVKNG